VLNAARLAGVPRVVLASTAAVYGIVRRPPVDERSRTHPDSPYAESKILAERLALDRAAAGGPAVVIARYPGVLGRGSLSWLGLFGAIGTGRFRMIGDGANHTHVAHVQDVIEGLIRCADTPGIENGVFNFAAGSAIGVRDFVDLIARVLGVSWRSGRVPLWPYAAHHRLNRVCYRVLRHELPLAHKYELFLSNKIMAIDRARRELGYVPSVSIEAAVRETADWHREFLAPARAGAGSAGAR
jgi:nucleoside-diphosphate-sugar epimerase